MHAGLVWLDGDKMSKSLGNLVYARDALKEHSANTLRWYLLGKHYRDEFHYEPAQVRQAAGSVTRLREAIAAPGGQATALDLSQVRTAFDEALADDLNTPLALELLGSATTHVLAAAAEQRDVGAAQATLAELAAVLGLTSISGTD
jgi:L-cysteine:1D-myo-inositol 2-amino-2-deoxy-alpha-D-glucopyranoside ligase